jgi:hypothetical protein
LALFLVLGGGTAYAVGALDGALAGQNTVGSLDIINGQVLGSDIGAGAVGATKLAAPEAWHPVTAGSTTSDACANAATAVFCSLDSGISSWIPWQNFGNGYAKAGFYKDQLGLVHLKGVVFREQGSVDPNPDTHVIFRLPPAYAPTHTRIFATVGRSESTGLEVAVGRIDVRPDGAVVFEWDCNSNYTQCSAFETGYISLDGISFRRDG